MNRKTQSKNLNRGNSHIIVSVLIMSALAIIIIALFQIMYRSARQNILNVWENNVIQLARETEYYMSKPMDVIEISARQVEEMMKDGSSDEEIADFLIKEEKTYSSIVENNFTGVYGCINGVYMDASGWTPPEDYDPTERPWYREAVDAGGRTVPVTSFLNLQTNENMLSVSRMLSDGRSVIAMDIFTDGIRSKLYDLVLKQGVKSAFIIDGKGRVVVHNKDESGKDYLSDDDEYKKKITELAYSIADDSTYSGRGTERGELVFAEKLNNGWYAVLVLNEDSKLSSIQYVNIALTLFLIAAIAAWYIIFARIDRKYREAENLSREVNAVADIYEAMTLVDLKTDSMTVLRSNDRLDSLLEGDLSGFSRRISGIASRIASDGSRDMLVRFMDPSTYEERIRDVRSLSHDCKTASGRWIRTQLIVVDRDREGRLHHIIWAIESIDEERRQQERLKELADTDALSRLRNRGSGEAAVRSMIDEGRKGLFILMDVDDFKSVNDTYGHDVGDLVIVAVADVLRKAVRESDIAFRLGGDEYAVFVPDMTKDSDRDGFVARLRSGIDSITLPELEGRTMTASIGSTYFLAEAGDSFEAVYQRADNEMYEEKRKKKSRR